jgi:hypothetical protein
MELGGTLWFEFAISIVGEMLPFYGLIVVYLYDFELKFTT